MEKYNFIRTIHPIGQGAFYSEKFRIGSEEHMIVYDCGAVSKNKKDLKSEISDFKLNYKGEIDALFISHFYQDHVNGIKELDDRCHIKKIIIPNLNENKWFYLVQSIVTDSFEETKAFFDFLDDNMKRVISVDPVREGIEDENNSETHLLEDLNPSKTIQSGLRLSLSDLKFAPWVFIPINFSYDKDKINELKRELENIDITFTGVENIPKLIADKRKEINDTYKKVFKNVNEASMLLYSGSNINTTEKVGPFIWCHSPWYYFPFRECPIPEACLYTGDATLNISRGTQIKKILSSLVQHIGTLQIPHHGAHRNFKIEDFSRESDFNFMNKICFASFGETNLYGHPSISLIEQVLSHGGFFRGITEGKVTSLIKCANIVTK